MSLFLTTLDNLYNLASGSDYIRDMRINEELNKLCTLLMEQSWHPEDAGLLPKKKASVVEVKDYLDKQIEEGEKNREVKTYFGRVRQIPEFASRKFMERELAKRLAMNTPIQGTAADIIKYAMNSVSSELERRGLRSTLILQIHDELIIEGPEGESAEVRSIIEECMKNAADLAVELVCDIHTGKTWYDLK